jgi:aldehyde dehydrogenase (NAD+)
MPGAASRKRRRPTRGPAHSASLEIKSGRRAGARRVCGGGRPPDLPRGWFVAPTVLDRVDPAWPIAREEVFGPVLAVTTFDSEAEALRLANGLDYGLVAGVYTRDIGRALRLARRLAAGSVWINGWYLGGQQAPTGGIKASGIGKERGLPGVRNYLHAKNVAVRLF